MTEFFKTGTRRARTLLRAASLAMLLAATLGGAAAAQNNPPPPGGKMSGPPPEALAACASKQVKDSCSMTLPGRNTQVAGKCIATPDKKVACLPDGAPPPQSN